MRKFTWKQVLIIAVIILAFVFGTIYYVKYESVFNSLVAVFCYSLGGVSFWYLRGLFEKFRNR